MIPSLLELECWWLTRGQASLRQLLKTQDIDLDAADAAKCIRRRLEEFEIDTDRREEVGDTIPIIRQQLSLDITALSPRRKLATALRQIFRDEANSGLCIERLSEGLTFIDDVEQHRALLISAAMEHPSEGRSGSDKLAILDALNNASRLHYEQCYIGLRIHVSNRHFKYLLLFSRARQSLIHLLAPSAENSELDILSRLYTIFMPISLLPDPDTQDHAAWSNSTEQAIRHCVFEHIVKHGTKVVESFEPLRLQLLGWCSLQDYAQVCRALRRYAEEVKKVEEICFELQSGLEMRLCSLTPAATSMLDASSQRSRSSSLVPTPIGSTDTSFQEGFSFLSSPNSDSLPSLDLSTALHPLLCGMPGRELSGSKIDGAGFAGDVTAPPILVYPEDLSRTEYDEHPLASSLNMSPREKAQLGLVIPKQISSRTF